MYKQGRSFNCFANTLTNFLENKAEMKLRTKLVEINNMLCTHYWCQNHHFQSWNELKRNEIGMNQQSVLTFGVQITISKVEMN